MLQYHLLGKIKLSACPMRRCLFNAYILVLGYIFGDVFVEFCCFGKLD